MEDKEWFKVVANVSKTILINQGDGLEELRFHHLIHSVKRKGLDIVIKDTEGVVLIQRLLSSDTTVGDTTENPGEVKKAMKEINEFMRVFSMISEIVETDDIGIIIKSDEELANDEFEITAEKFKKMKAEKQ